MAGQLGQTAVNFADNVMVGKLGASSLAAVSFANAIFGIFFVVGMGISFALPPLISEASGAGEDTKISQYFKHSFIVNLVFAVLSLAILLGGLSLLDHMGQHPEVVVLAKKYLVYTAWSMIPFMIFQALRCYSDGMSETLLPMIVIIAGNVLNVGLNYLLIFGKYGFPAMGVEGASLASLIARVFMVAMIVLLMMRWKNLWSYIQSCNFKKYQKSIYREILKLGVPTSLQMFFEVSAFSGAAIITGMLSKNALAAHQVAINLASFTFMICTGLAMAATIRVGNQYGKRDMDKVRGAGISAMLQVSMIMGVFAILFYVFKGILPYMYIDDMDVISVASSLLIMAAIFQIPDGIQVVAQSALRGLQDVKVPTIVTFVSYWLVGIPFSYISAIHFGWGPQGVWIGLILGLSISAIFLTIRFYRLSSSRDLNQNQNQDQ